MFICSSAYAVGISCLLVAFLREILAALNPDSKKKLILLLWFIIIDQSANNTFLLLALCTAIAEVTNLFSTSLCREELWLQKCKCSFFVSSFAHTSKSQWSHWDNSRAQDCATWDQDDCVQLSLKVSNSPFSLWHTSLKTFKLFILIIEKVEGLSLPELQF